MSLYSNVRDIDEKFLPDGCVLMNGKYWAVYESNGYNDWVHCLFLNKGDAEEYIENSVPAGNYFYLHEYDIEYYDKV